MFGSAQKGHKHPHGTGWLPDVPDHRDHTLNHDEVIALHTRSSLRRLIADKAKPPRSVDLKQWCPPIQFQGGYNTCNAHAVLAMVEFFQRKVLKQSVTLSRLFLYKVTKNYLQVSGNAPVYIRQTMGALTSIGVPLEIYWPYLDGGTPTKLKTNDPRLDVEPPPFCYAAARDYRAVRYYRLDGPGISPQEMLRSLKAHLVASIPVTFGFPLYPSLEQAKKSGAIPLPVNSEAQIGSHAVLAVGYDDGKKIKNVAPGGIETTGAVLIRNSWGTSWGEEGYGWLPYQYIVEGGRDLWVLLKADWLNSKAFQLEGKKGS